MLSSLSIGEQFEGDLGLEAIVSAPLDHQALRGALRRANGSTRPRFRVDGDEHVRRDQGTKALPAREAREVLHVPTDEGDRPHAP